MTIWILAIGLLAALGMALIVASFGPLGRRRRDEAPLDEGQPLFFERHRSPVRPPLSLAAEYRARSRADREVEKS